MQKLLEDIECVRAEMCQLADALGLLAPEVISKSQELDQLLNEFSQYQTMNKLA